MYIFKPAEFKILTNEVKTLVTQSIQDMLSQEEEATVSETSTTQTTITGKATENAPDVSPSEKENSHMFWGNPSNATTDANNATNYLMIKDIAMHGVKEMK